MTEKQFEELKLLVEQTTRDTVEACFDNWKATLVTKLDFIISQNSQIQTVVDLTNSDMGHDREGDANMRSQMMGVATSVKELLRITSTQTEKITKDVNSHADKLIETAAQTVAENVEPAMATAVDKIKKGKPLITTPKKGWFSFFRRKK